MDVYYIKRQSKQYLLRMYGNTIKVYYNIQYTSSERLAPVLTSSYLIEPGLMASTRSMTGMELAIELSLKLVIEVVFPDSLRVVFTQSMISGSLIGLSDFASR